jgi:DsbC/DsbD-like thiol-disulfide interchange protein
MFMNRTLAFSIALPALAAASIWVGPTAYADAPTHEIRKTEPRVAAGGQAKASLTIAAKNGWHVNAEAPITVSLKSSDAGLTVAKEKMTRADLAESTQTAARFDIALTCAADAAAGPKTINAEAKFVMCQESACKPVKETLALAIEVTPAAVAGGKKPGKAKTK